MTRLVVLSGLLVWTGATVLLAELRWFSRLPLLERLRPYTAAAAATPSRAGLLSVESLGEVIGPVARGLGERVARVFGVSEELALRLERIHAALDRLAARGTGNAARDLARVCGRMRQGLSEVEALREWAAVARVEALDRLVPMLGLNSEAADLGRLVSDEARSIRREVHRRLVETMERRGQQVWIPVTVATLVPGVIFLAIPFIEALRLFAGP